MHVFSDITKTLKKYTMCYISILLFVFVSLFVLYGASSGYNQQYSFLAQSFLSGHLHFLQVPYGGNDTVFYLGNYYWPLGPFPAIVLIPFVYIFNSFGYQFYEAYLHFFVFCATFIIYYRIARKLNYSQRDALFWASAYCFASPLLGIATHPFSWFFAHNIASFLAGLSILTFLTKRSYWLIGIFLGLLLATRITAGIISVFFILELVTSPSRKQRLPNLISLLLPLLMSALLLGWYNHARFGSFFESGYSMQIFSNHILQKTRESGVFTFRHIPGNVYYFLLHGPQPIFRDGISRVLRFPFVKPDAWGMGIFFTSPYLLFLFLLNYKDRLSKLLLLSTTLTALPLLLFFGIGYYQYGYRFSLDFLPLVMLLLMKNYRQTVGKLSMRFRILLSVAIVWNVYLTLAMFSNT